MGHSLTLRERIKGGRREEEEVQEEQKEKTHKREILPIKLSSTRSGTTKRQRVALQQSITSGRVRHPTLRSMMHA